MTTSATPTNSVSCFPVRLRRGRDSHRAVPDFRATCGKCEDRARYYHPGLARFISEDPIGLRAGDTNFYIYAGDNPLRFADPLGLDKEGPFDEPGLGTPWLDPIDLIGGAGGLTAKLIGKLAAKQAAKTGGKIAFELAPRVIDQLADARLGQLAGRLTPDRLQELLNNPAAQRFLDTTSGHINVIQEVEGVLLWITTPRDAFRIISIGPIREKALSMRLNGDDSCRYHRQEANERRFRVR